MGSHCLGSDLATMFKVHILLLATLAVAHGSPKPDYGVQPGDDGTYQGAHDHHHHHHHHDEAELDAPAPPPPPPPAPEVQKKCTLVRETENKGPMCILEPECKNECENVPEEKCTVVQKQQCKTINQKSCNTLQEEVCETNYQTQYENQCENKIEKQCETKSELSVREHWKKYVKPPL